VNSPPRFQRTARPRFRRWTRFGSTEQRSAVPPCRPRAPFRVRRAWLPRLPSPNADPSPRPAGQRRTGDGSTLREGAEARDRFSAVPAACTISPRRRRIRGTLWDSGRTRRVRLTRCPSALTTTTAAPSTSCSMGLRRVRLPASRCGYYPGMAGTARRRPGASCESRL
jgi:hypothetical protein